MGVPAASVHVVPPFVHDLDLQARADGPPCVLFVGRLAEAKGVREAVKAWRRSGVELPLVLAGTGPLRAELEAEAARAKGPPLEVLGWVEREPLSALYARAAAVILPSRWQEPFGIVGLEALRFGVPVVAWESGGVGEWHPGPGLVRWGDVSALARALAKHVGRGLLLLPRFDRDEAIWTADGALRTGCGALSRTNGKRKRKRARRRTSFGGLTAPRAPREVTSARPSSRRRSTSCRPSPRPRP